MFCNSASCDSAKCPSDRPSRLSVTKPSFFLYTPFPSNQPLVRSLVRGSGFLGSSEHGGRPDPFEDPASPAPYS
jgi:hypothetical protein